MDIQPSVLSQPCIETHGGISGKIIGKYSRAVCSIATRDYLPRLIVLYNSILEHQNIPLYLLIVDIEPEEKLEMAAQLSVFFPESARSSIHLIAPGEIYGQAIHQMRFYYDIFELSTACKGGVLSWMQRNTAIDRWLFLDCDMFCFGSLEPFFSALDTASILITPHRDKPCATVLGDIEYLATGTFNAGVIGVRRSPTSQGFTDWLCKVFSHFCLNDASLPIEDRFVQSALLFVDQTWIDLVPAYFPDVIVQAGRGFNLGHWNAEEGRLMLRDGELYMGEDRITLFHLSGWLEDQPGRLSRYSSLDWSDNPVWIDLHNKYRESLSRFKESFTGAKRYLTYPDGSDIPRLHRRAYLRHLLDGNPPVGSFSYEEIAAIADHYETQLKASSKYHHIIAERDNQIMELRNILDNMRLRDALKRFRRAHRPVIGWFLRTMTNYYSKPARTLMEELLSCDDKTFITKTFAFLLGRAPDPDGMEHYSTLLNKGVSRTRILDSICNSSECLSRMAERR